MRLLESDDVLRETSPSSQPEHLGERISNGRFCFRTSIGRLSKQATLFESVVVVGVMPEDCVSKICSRWEWLVGVKVILLDVCKLGF